MRSLVFEPLIAPALWITLAVVASVLLLVYGLRRPPMIAPRRWAAVLLLMATGISLVLVVLLNPTWVERIAPPEGKPLLTVLVDSSQSMSTRDAGGNQSRYEVAGEQAAQLARELERRFEVRIRTFDAGSVPASAGELSHRTPDGQNTDLHAAIVGSLVEDRPQGQALALLSDGIHTAGGGTSRVFEAVDLARAMAAPVYTRTFGGHASVRDVAVELDASQQLAYIGQQVPITARIEHSGLSGESVRVALYSDGREIDHQEVTLSIDNAGEVRFHVSRRERGLYRYDVGVDPLLAETTETNNRAAYVLHVVDEPIRVLLVEGKPYWDTKFFLRTLASDPSIALDSVVRLTKDRFLRRTLARAATDGHAGPPESPEPEKAAKPPDAREEQWTIVSEPAGVLADVEQLKTYQIIVLGHDTEVFLTSDALSSLRTWISREGGSLVCYRGAPVAQVNEQLGRMMPVRWSPTRESRFRVRLTDRGRDMDWLSGADEKAAGSMLSMLPALATIAKSERPKPTAVVLVSAADETGGDATPVLAYQPYGIGRVVAVEGAGMWRWAFLPPEHEEHDAVYHCLWQSLVRWLVSSANLLPGQDITLRPGKITYSMNEPVTAMLLMRKVPAEGQVPIVELIDATSREHGVFVPSAIGDEPGVFRVMFGRLPEGRYRARVRGRPEGDESVEAVFDVRTVVEEQLNLKARPDLMAHIAGRSGGAVVGLDPSAEIAKQFEEYLAVSRPERARRLTAWDRWWVFVGIILVWTVAWGLRRSGGLI